MPRGRKPDAPAPSAAPELLPHDTQAIAELHRASEAVVVEFGDGLPWHADHYEAEIRGELRRGCESFLRAGRLLVVARQCATHGEWSGMLDRLGLDRTHAHRMMEAAKRVANVATSQHLIAAAKSQGKLIELLSLPEDQFTELAETGETAGLDLDDVAGMTVRELRDAVREARADIAAKEEVSAAKERKIERLTADLAKAKRQRARATPDEVAAELRERLMGSVMQARADLFGRGDDADTLRERIRELREWAAENEQDDEHVPHMAGVIAELIHGLVILRDEFGLPELAPKGWQPDPAARS